MHPGTRITSVSKQFKGRVPTICSGCKIEFDELFKTLFSIRSTNRDFYAREAQFTAMDVRKCGESDQEP